jgi:hypothetical protein
MNVGAVVVAPRPTCGRRVPRFVVFCVRMMSVSNLNWTLICITYPAAFPVWIQSVFIIDLFETTSFIRFL